MKMSKAERKEAIEHNRKNGISNMLIIIIA